MNNKKCEKCDKMNSHLSKFCSQCGFELPKEKLTENFNTDRTEKKSETRKKILPIIIGIIAFGISFFAVQKLFNNHQSFDKAMMKAASEINESCPIMIDNDTRLDNTVAMPDNIFQYNYTLINLEKSKINIEELKSYIEPNVVNNVKTNPDMKAYKDNKVTMAYNYKDKNGEFILKINVTPEKYE